MLILTLTKLEDIEGDGDPTRVRRSRRGSTDFLTRDLRGRIESVGARGPTFVPFRTRFAFQPAFLLLLLLLNAFLFLLFIFLKPSHICLLFFPPFSERKLCPAITFIMFCHYSREESLSLRLDVIKSRKIDSFRGIINEISMFGFILFFNTVIDQESVTALI